MPTFSLPSTTDNLIDAATDKPVIKKTRNTKKAANTPAPAPAAGPSPTPSPAFEETA